MYKIKKSLQIFFVRQIIESDIVNILCIELTVFLSKYVTVKLYSSVFYIPILFHRLVQ